MGCVDGGGGSAVFREDKEVRRGGSGAGVGGTYVQAVSGEGEEAVEDEEGEGVLGGSVDSAGWNIVVVVSVRQRFSWIRQTFTLSFGSGDPKKTYFVL